MQGLCPSTVGSLAAGRAWQPSMVGRPTQTSVSGPGGGGGMSTRGRGSYQLPGTAWLVDLPSLPVGVGPRACSWLMSFPCIEGGMFQERPLGSSLAGSLRVLPYIIAVPAGVSPTPLQSCCSVPLLVQCLPSCRLLHLLHLQGLCGPAPACHGQRQGGGTPPPPPLPPPPSYHLMHHLLLPTAAPLPLFSGTCFS